MEWEDFTKWLIANKELIGVASTVILTVIAVWAFFFGGIKQVVALFRRSPPPPQPPAPSLSAPETQTLVDNLLAERQSKTEMTAEFAKEREELEKTIEALKQQAGPNRDEALAALEEGNTEKAETLFVSIAKDREKFGAKANQEAAEAWRHTGSLAYLNEPLKAVRAYANAAELDPDDAAGWAWLGILQRRIGDLMAAERSQKKVLSLGKRSSDKTTIAMATGNLGSIYLQRGDVDKAEEMCLKALDVYRGLGRKDGMVNQYGNLGNIHRARGDLDKAEEMYLKTLRIEQELGRKESIANGYGNLGLIHLTPIIHRTALPWLWRSKLAGFTARI